MSKDIPGLPKWVPGGLGMKMRSEMEGKEKETVSLPCPTAPFPLLGNDSVASSLVAGVCVCSTSVQSKLC